MKLKLTLFWIVAIVITIGAAIYQRKTGPTYPLEFELETKTGTESLSLVRSHGGDQDCRLTFNVKNQDIQGTYSYRRFPTNDTWTTKAFQKEDSTLVGILPHQAPAGKIEYKVEFTENDQILKSTENLHTVVRFKGDVPAGVLIPHIFFIFFAMLLSNFTGILAIDKHHRTKLYTILTITFLFIGGLLFGPLVQKYAFGEYWTGVPFGWDLTDNKTLIAFLAWAYALIMSIKQKKIRYDLILIAALTMLIIFSIPHSMFGSELDYTTGDINQG